MLNHVESPFLRPSASAKSDLQSKGEGLKYLSVTRSSEPRTLAVSLHWSQRCRQDAHGRKVARVRKTSTHGCEHLIDPPRVGGCVCFLAIRSDAEIVPTNGTNIQEVESGQFTLQLWEVGGQEKVRPYWDRYAEGINGLVYVIDMAAKERLQEAIDALANTHEKIGLTRLPTLVLMNRSENDADVAEVEALLSAIPGMDQNPHAVVQVSPDRLTLGGGQESLKWMGDALLKAVERAEDAQRAQMVAEQTTT